MKKPMGRILALDIGDVRIGTSISDPLGITTTSVGNITGENRKEKVEGVIKIVNEHQPAIIIVGMPINMDGSRGAAAKKVKKFVQMLKKETSIPVETIDERLTTVEAERVLLSADVRRSDRRKVIDGMAASLILQKYLNSIETEGKID